MTTKGNKTEGAQGNIDKALIREYWRLWNAHAVIDQCMEEYNNMGQIITEIRVRGPEVTRGGYMAVIKVIDEGRHPFVAFRTAETSKALFEKVAFDIENQTLNLKEEQPYDPQGKKAQDAPEKAGRQNVG